MLHFLADHWANRKLLQAMLAQRGYSADVAENGLECVQVPRNASEGLYPYCSVAV